MEIKGNLLIWEYVIRRQAIIAEYVSGRPIYELFTGVDSMKGSSRFLRWWYQVHIPKQAER